MEELKNDLLKRIDIYSIGIIILIIINTYITTNIHIYRQDLIIKLYNIIYLCCNQEAKCANINEIISKYDAIIHVYSQILEEESRRQESARQKEEEEIKAETTQKTERQETQKRQLESQQELTDKLQRISTP
jgi:Skp family chaperone for outer membrane proteins